MKAAENPCKLYCKPKTQIFFKYFDHFLLDGTPCSASSNDLCVEGKCTVIIMVRFKIKNTQLYKYMFSSRSVVIGF